MATKSTTVKKAVTAKPKSKSPPSHPPYIEMIKEALVALKERTGSSQYAIAKHMEEHQKVTLPPNFKKLLAVQIKKLVAGGKLVKVKNSFRLPSGKKSAPSADVNASKPKKVMAVKPKKAVTGKTRKKVETVVKKAKKEVVEKKKVKVTAKSPVKKVKKAVVEKKKPKSIKSPVKRKAAAVAKEPAAKKAKK